MNQIPKVISEKILTIGPDYHNHRGGIGALIEIYSRSFENFKFLPSYKTGLIFSKSIFFIGCTFKLFIQLICDRKIKIIHIHGASYGSFHRKFVIFIISKYIFRKKIIYHIHGGRFDKFYMGSPKPNGVKQNFSAITKVLINFMLKNINLLICLSYSWQEYFIKTLNVPNSRCIILNNVVDNKITTYKREIGKTIKIVFLGEIDSNKGIFDLLNVINKNKKKFENEISLLIGGKGETQKLVSFIKLNNLDRIVEYVGWVNSAEKFEILSNSNILILPSYAEGLPISILEGLTYGLTIIATNVGGISEVVINNFNGKLIEPGNLKQIEESILYFFENPNEMVHYGANSIEIAKKYNPDYVFNKLINIYQNIL